ncbi:MAG TPA: response regulator transcription factor [Streptosporangiaceae bacterium]|nr:response regulator transcription factor [Streptosporangiaceae bacterium]
MVVDDHRLVRAGLITLLEAAGDIEVAGEAADGRQALEAARAVAPDVVLMDLSMPVLDGVAATRLLLQEQPRVRVVALTSFSDRQRVNDVLAAGAIGYLLKDSRPDELLAAVRSAAEGHAPLDPRVAGALLPGREPPAADLLSEREKQVLRLAAAGLANKQIARRLGLSESTVKVHIGNIFRQIGVRDRTSAALWAREHLPSPPSLPVVLVCLARGASDARRAQCRIPLAPGSLMPPSGIRQSRRDVAWVRLSRVSAA